MLRKILVLKIFTYLLKVCTIIFCINAVLILSIIGSYLVHNEVPMPLIYTTGLFGISNAIVFVVFYYIQIYLYKRK